MARSVNKVILLGRIGKEPELTYIPSGQSVAKFTMATNRSYKDKSGEWKEETDWHNIVAWGKLGEICAQYLAKGRQAYVEGQIRTRSWEDREGKKRTKIELRGSTVRIVGAEGNAIASSPFSLEPNRTYEVLCVFRGAAAAVYIDGKLTCRAATGGASGAGPCAVQLGGVGGVVSSISYQVLR